MSMNLFLLLTQKQIKDMHNYSLYFFTFLPYPQSFNNNIQHFSPALLYNVSNYTNNHQNHPIPPLEPIPTTTDRQSPNQALHPYYAPPNINPPPNHVNQAIPSEYPQRNNLVVDQNVYKYPKKNAESNLTNQIFSYISISAKSSNVLLRLLEGRNDKVRVFYSFMKQVKRHNKKYINREYVRDLMALKRSHIMDGILQKTKIETTFTLQELRSAIRRLVFHYLTHTCTLTLLTSNKLDRYSLREHLQRRRDVAHYLKQSLSHAQQ